VYKCGICGKQFSTAQALGGHRAYCGKLVRVVSEGPVRVQPSVNSLKSLPSLPSLPSLAVRQAEDASKSYQLTGKHFGQVQISWGRMLASLAIGSFVAWLVYQSLQNWDWKGGSGKKQISPYKLIGSLVSGLG